MEPRLKTSSQKKSVLIPGDLKDLITQLLTENFEKELSGRTLIVDGRIFEREIIVRAGLAEPGKLSQKNVEASIDYDPKRNQAVDQIHHCVEAIGASLGEVLASDQMDAHSSLWQPYKLSSHTVFLRVSSSNFALEAEADKLLGDYELDLIASMEDEEHLDPMERLH